MGPTCKHTEFISGCRRCWLWAHRADYRRLWGGDPAEAVPAPDPWKANTLAVPPPKDPVKNPCVYRGPATGKAVLCPTCRGQVRIKLYVCRLFGECTLVNKADRVACCGEPCPKYSTRSEQAPGTPEIASGPASP